MLAMMMGDVSSISRKNARVAVIMGSDSDLEVMKDACAFLDELNVAYEVSIVSAHRTPERMYDYAKSARERGIEVIIAAAGGAAHLPGMVASLTTLPVIGVPIKSATLNGLDSLLSIVQMPPGVPVATVAINGARNAAILACEILAIKDQDVAMRLERYKSEMRDKVLDAATRLEGMGYKAYLEQKGSTQH
ncbi:N5-carboxyaminoimidazole ribonucleotide mutase [Candidatus Nitrosocaldus cavascurensis]|jgi:5-(carboxyamino)imidazole ribonucleotide mutase|uniref:N5-carboxyaminoimidazole ribonucleotide mutase n=2 Tax=Candidatus Nitrosocaldaceae TaxID=1968910 RepID=A0A2K5AQW6_9ARCH|nr:5-(carboxyamino)imidazole ribonucleotide mutase [Candidatus Nitrosocaldus cavascurensis]SPC34017.1 N5-carboxyaminoimidazole ribonucleotide mutase [Candidatus Nitrosocaldus cavascurensis]